MKQNTCVQVQAVIYNNEKEAVLKAVRALANAVRVEREAAGLLQSVSLVYGDASEKAVFTDEEITAIQEKFQPYLDFRYEVFGFNSGYGKGNNLLGLSSSADYLLIMNPDIVLCPRFFIEMLYPFADPQVGLVEARQTPVEHHKEYDPETMETDWATGACFMVPAALFRHLNGFDSETFFMYCEDVDFSWRLRLLGYKIFYQPLAPVFHAKRLSQNANWKPGWAEEYYSAQSALLMAHKWSNPDRVEKVLRFYQNSQNKNWREAADHFVKRRQENSLPQPLDPDHKVSRFVGNYYSENRFVL